MDEELRPYAAALVGGVYALAVAVYLVARRIEELAWEDEPPPRKRRIIDDRVPWEEPELPEPPEPEGRLARLRAWVKKR